MGKAVPRNGALVNDKLYVTGTLGLSDIGLKKIKVENNEFDIAKNKYLLPEPRVKLAIQLRKYVNSMIDISDGLMQDASHLAKTSGLELELDVEKIPVADFKSLKKQEIFQSAMYGGDDYELLFSISPRNERYLKKLEKEFDINISKIGKFKKGKIGKIFSKSDELITKSYLHF